MSDAQGLLDIDISPVDMLAGLGKADRELLATCLALFDDSQLQHRLARLSDQASEHLSKWGKKLKQPHQEAPSALPEPEVQAAARELSERQSHWRASPHSDDMLRLMLWIRLRQALKLPAQLSTTYRGCGYLADDLAARLIHVLDPPGLVNSGRRWLHQQGWLEKGEYANSLTDIVMPVLDELLEKALVDEQKRPDRYERRQLLAQAVSSLGQLDAEEYQQLLDDTRVDRTNDTALRNTLLLGGSLGAISTSVGSAGFSAYILAAQASAFIPWISGPGLVSFVSVLSNPGTILAATGLGGWWLMNRARDKVDVALSARVVAMLALNGLQHGRSGLSGMLHSFTLTPYLPRSEGLSDKKIEAYRAEWKLLAPLATKPRSEPSKAVIRAMATPLDTPLAEPDLTENDEPTTGYERNNLAAMAALTVGDMVYSAGAVDPNVVAAADFIHEANIDAGLSFARLAERIIESGQAASLGSVSQLKGYVAEQAVASELAAAGHTVSLPDTANNPGWDLLVDGQPFQVKFHASLDGLRQHFDQYNYPVIANTELIEKIPDEWRDQVFFLDGLSNELVEQITRESLAAGADMLAPNVMPAAGAISTTRALLAYQRGRLTGKQALEQVMLDGMVRLGLAGSGSVIGAGVGLTLFGPAGAPAPKTQAPVFSQMLTPRVTRLLRDKVKGDAYHHWENTAQEHLTALQQRILTSLRHKRDQLRVKLNACPSNMLGDYLRWRLEDDHYFTLECQQRLQTLKAESWPQPEQRLAEILRIIAVSGVHPATYQAELNAVSVHLEHRPGLSDLMDRQQLTEATRHLRNTADYWKQVVNQKAEEQGWRGKATSLAQRWRKPSSRE